MKALMPSAGCPNRSDYNLSGAVLFPTCEPCPLCTSLAIQSNLTTIVYGISMKTMLLLGKPVLIQMSARQVIENSACWIEIVDGVLSEQCRKLYQ
jgi:tRNA(adenine34) deaminase